MRSRPGLPRAAFAIAAWCLAAAVLAHDFIVVRAAVVVDGATVSVTLLVDQADLLAGLGERRLLFDDLAEVDALKERIGAHLLRVAHLRADGAEAPLRYAGCIDVATAADRSAEPPTQLSLLLRADLAGDVHRIAFAIEPLGERGTPLIATMHLQAGDRRLVRTVGNGEAVELALTDEPPAPGTATTTSPAATPGATAPAEETDWRDWLREGFRHIVQRGFWSVIFVDHDVPDGLDHILFVVGLYLLSPRLKPLLTQVTAFTVAHSLTLGLSLIAHWKLPSAFVEPMIAASIAAVAIENVLTREVKPWRWMVVFGFGLVHGMGFAAALAEAVPPGRVWGPLLMMNLGVECGQLTVVAAVAAVTLPFAHRSSYRRVIVIPASVAIAATGLWWAVERIWPVLATS